MSQKHPFHRPQTLSALPDAGLDVTIEAKPAEMPGLADFLDVESVFFVRAVLHLVRWRREGVRVTGTIIAHLRQSCVVTLEPVDANLNLTLDRKFLPNAMLARDADPHEHVINPNGEDPPDPLPHSLDLGEMVAEELALNVDPYPRRPGVEVDEPVEIAPIGPESPFGALKDLAGKLGKPTSNDG